MHSVSPLVRLHPADASFTAPGELLASRDARFALLVALLVVFHLDQVVPCRRKSRWVTGTVSHRGDRLALLSSSTPFSS